LPIFRCSVVSFIFPLFPRSGNETI
jgi:hypothetical protein